MQTSFIGGKDFFHGDEAHGAIVTLLLGETADKSTFFLNDPVQHEVLVRARNQMVGRREERQRRDAEGDRQMHRAGITGDEQRKAPDEIGEFGDPVTAAAVQHPVAAGMDELFPQGTLPIDTSDDDGHLGIGREDLFSQPGEVFDRPHVVGMGRPHLEADQFPRPALAGPDRGIPVTVPERRDFHGRIDDRAAEQPDKVEPIFDGMLPFRLELVREINPLRTRRRVLEDEPGAAQDRQGNVLGAVAVTDEHRFRPLPAQFGNGAEEPLVAAMVEDRLVDVGETGEERRHVAVDQEGDPRLGKRLPQALDRRRREQRIAKGRRRNDQETGRWLFEPVDGLHLPRMDPQIVFKVPVEQFVEESGHGLP